MNIQAYNQLTDLKALAKVIFWIADGANVHQHDIGDRISQISSLASELAEDAMTLANEIERNSTDE